MTGYPQIIKPKDLGLTLKPGFGYSLSKDKIDVDDNNCNDFVVGYPNSNQAVLLRSKEVVILEETLNPVVFQNITSIDPPTNPIKPGKLVMQYEKNIFHEMKNSNIFNRF